LLAEFMEGKHETARVLLVEGAGGIGKSRLLSEVTARISNEVTIAKLNFASDGIKRRGLLSSLQSESRRLRKILMKHNSLEAWKLNLYRFKTAAKRVIPSVGSAIPHFGDFTRRLLEVALEDRDPESEGYSSWINHFLSVCEFLSTFGSLVIAVDDYHNLSGDEQFHLSELLARLVEVDARNLRAVVAARPFINRAQIPYDGLTNAFQRAARNGQLLILKLEPLNGEFLVEISGGLFTNPLESGPLVELASGSPQRLLELLIKLNVNGDLRSTENRITLPVQVGRLTYLTEDLWTQIARSRLGLEIVSILAVGPRAVGIDNLYYFAQCLNASFSEIIASVSELQKLSVLQVAGESGSSRAELRFSHDTLRDQVAARLRLENAISYIYFNEVSSQLVSHLLAKHLRQQAKEFDSLRLPDALDSEALDLMTIRAVNLRESRKLGWEEAALDAASRCFSHSRVHSTIQLLEPAINSLSSFLKPEARVILNARELIVKAQYELANYQTVVQLSNSLPTEDAGVTYAIALSIIIEKEEDWFSKAQRLLQPAIRSKRMVKQRPLLKSALAIANRERNQVELGERMLREIVAEGQGQTDDQAWYQFLAVASIYLKNAEGEECAKKAFEYFTNKGGVRAAGIAATNLSVLAAQQRNVDESFRYCEVSEALLRQAGSGDVVFPITNRAALHLSVGEPREPLSLLQSSLFRRLPPEYELTVMVDLSLAQWANGKAVDLEPLKRLRATNRNTWLGWLTAFNCAFLELDGGHLNASADQVRKLYNDVIAADPDGRAHAFWNALVAKLNDSQFASEFHMDINTKQSPLQELADPATSIGRPIFLSFGHI
jgi:hypothetical protein